MKHFKSFSPALSPQASYMHFHFPIADYTTLSFKEISGMKFLQIFQIYTQINILLLLLYANEKIICTYF